MNIFTVLVLSGFASGAFASEKICFATKNSGAKGDICKISVARNRIKIEPVVGDQFWDGTYQANSSTVKGKDGVTYLNYRAHGEEGCNQILVDEALLKPGSKGTLKFRCRGEGFGDTKFFCRDSK